MLALGLETSCDETGIGLVDSERGVVAGEIFSQAELHRPHGGVVPELASRDHLKKLLPLVRKALRPYDLKAIDAVAYAKGPGLIGALLTGATFAHSLAWALARPAIGVHHMEAHLLVCELGAAAFKPPYLALLVSGGHTQLVEVRGLGNYRLLGETLDDAVGEAFDKVARMLGLTYPGGPAIQQLAQNGREGRFEFSRPMSDRRDLNFSFSGLKTQVLRAVQRQGDSEQERADIALAFETAAVDALMIKCRQALALRKTKKLVIAGGVAANLRLRKSIESLRADGTEVFCPPQDLCTDNGVMIAHAGLLRLQAGQAPDRFARAHPRWGLNELADLGAVATRAAGSEQT